MSMSDERGREQRQGKQPSPRRTSLPVPRPALRHPRAAAVFLWGEAKVSGLPAAHGWPPSKCYWAAPFRSGKGGGGSPIHPLRWAFLPTLKRDRSDPDADRSDPGADASASVADLHDPIADRSDPVHDRSDPHANRSAAQRDRSDPIADPSATNRALTPCSGVLFASGGGYGGRWRVRFGGYREIGERAAGSAPSSDDGGACLTPRLKAGKGERPEFHRSIRARGCRLESKLFTLNSFPSSCLESQL